MTLVEPWEVGTGNVSSRKTLWSWDEGSSGGSYPTTTVSTPEQAPLLSSQLLLWADTNNQTLRYSFQQC